MKTQVLVNHLNDSEFLEYPPLVMEDEYYDSDPDTRMKMGKFNKLMKRITPDFDELWKQQLTIKQSCREFNFMLTHLQNDESITYLIGMYAKLMLDVQVFQKMLKKSDQEVQKYYCRFSQQCNADVFVVMMEDAEHAVHEATKGMARSKSQYPDFPYGDITINVDDFPIIFKDKVKKIKNDQNNKK